MEQLWPARRRDDDCERAAGGRGAVTSLALAPRAERRRPQVDRVRGDEFLAARDARLAAPPVHLQLELEAALLSGAGAVVAYRRARGPHGALQHVRHRGV